MLQSAHSSTQPRLSQGWALAPTPSPGIVNSFVCACFIFIFGRCCETRSTVCSLFAFSLSSRFCAFFVSHCLPYSVSLSLFVSLSVRVRRAVSTNILITKFLRQSQLSSVAEDLRLTSSPTMPRHPLRRGAGRGRAAFLVGSVERHSPYFTCFDVASPPPPAPPPSLSTNYVCAHGQASPNDPKLPTMSWGQVGERKLLLYTVFYALFQWGRGAADPPLPPPLALPLPLLQVGQVQMSCACAIAPSTFLMTFITLSGLCPVALFPFSHHSLCSVPFRSV